MPDSLDGLRREIDNLREWRHKTAAPILWAVNALLEADDGLASLGGRIQALHGRVDAMERRLDQMEPRLERLARADEIGAAVTQALKTEHSLILTRTQKIVGGLAASILFAVAIVDFVRTFTG